jgi:hypothetical protein
LQPSDRSMDPRWRCGDLEPSGGVFRPRATDAGIAAVEPVYGPAMEMRGFGAVGRGLQTPPRGLAMKRNKPRQFVRTTSDEIFNAKMTRLST